ncbi:hypothetical protein KC19_4G244000 [Ceratodon purpureus]|uniref:Uncharacterized protein n=1 Tax=Ceratodon purpureus TaxID=3225 RepID=A0A8T0IC71_CERPU|nr:hypothetical protein KC19_4G244000 [Ceratodon purpureus]
MILRLLFQNLSSFVKHKEMQPKDEPPTKFPELLPKYNVELLMPTLLQHMKHTALNETHLVCRVADPHITSPHCKFLYHLLIPTLIQHGKHQAVNPMGLHMGF